MRDTFDDIRSRITEEPTWYDENGTPRYGVFSPVQCPNIYANQAVLLRIACQSCEREFLVEMSGGWFIPINEPKRLHYGDPPAHHCIGDTENCDDLYVVEVWARDRSEWKRIPELEGKIE
jgi:hypothetical protein